MATDFRTAIIARRSYYGLKPESSIPDADIKEILDFAIRNSPSAFNSQSARIVLLLGENHKKLWNIVRETLRKILPTDKFKDSDDKIRGCFECGYGTALFYEDWNVVEKLQKNFPLYADAFPGFSCNSAGMLQLVVWTMLRDAGMGATLQHYGNLIEKEVADTWKLDPKWRLIAQMPFGIPDADPGEKEQLPLEQRIKVFA